MKTKHVQYQTQGTCSQLIDVTADEHDVIQQVFFLGGCNGNLQGISQLVRGQKIDSEIDADDDETIHIIICRKDHHLLPAIIVLECDCTGARDYRQRKYAGK